MSAKTQLMADEEYMTLARKGLDYTYNMEFRRAETIFRQMKYDHPDHPGPYLLTAMNLFWQISLDEQNKSLDNTLLYNINKARELNRNLKDRPELKIEYTFSELMTHIFEARIFAMRRKWAKCVNSASKVFDPMKEGKKLLPESDEFLFGCGCYNYYAEAFPDKNPVVKPFMNLLPKGDRHNGLRELEQASRAEIVTRREAAYYLTNIYLNYECNYPKALRLSRSIHIQYPGNTIFTANYGISLFHNHKYAEAEQVLTKLKSMFEAQSGYEDTRISFKHSHYSSQLMINVYYYLGLTELFKNRDEIAAIKNFFKCRRMCLLADFSDHDNVASSIYHTAVCYDRLGKRSLAKEMYKKLLKDSNYKSKAKGCLESPCTKF